MGNLELGDNLHFCFFIVVSLPPVGWLKCVSISTSSKARREAKSAKASMAIVTLPWARIEARCSKVAEVLEGSITAMALEQKQKVEGGVRRRRGEQARRRAAST